MGMVRTVLVAGDAPEAILSRHDVYLHGGNKEYRKPLDPWDKEGMAEKARRVAALEGVSCT